MSCQIKAFANLTNTSNIKELLFSDSTKQFDTSLDELPLQDCLVSLSSAGDVLAMAYNTKMIILISRWDSLEPDEIKTKFHMIWHGDIAKEPLEWITSVICIPLLSLGKACSGTNPDWTCIIVGYNTGFIKFYTETGALLLEEQLHDEPVIGLKCQSFRGAKHAGDTALTEEVYVIYNSVVCVLQGFSLFSTLRSYKNYIARVQANCDTLPPNANLSCKKWSYISQDIVNDAEVIGTTTVNSFDHLMTASISGGFHASYRASAPQHSLVIATGKRPFVGFYYALEGSTAPILSDVAIAMAGKLASAIGTAVPWFSHGWGNSKSQASLDATKLSAQEPAERMTCGFGLSDITREGYSIVSSPNKMLSVITDAMGRVLLIDNRHGVAIKMWKGYREAQCGWIEVEEDRHPEMQKKFNKFKHSAGLHATLFLVIYAPKKGIIDIWSTQQGPKITTFSASKHGRLLSIGYGLLGMTDNVYLSKNKPQYSCVFMDPLGGLKEITVPFHFALNSKNRKRARDIYLVKKLKTFLREEEFDQENLILKIQNTCSDMKTNEIKVQMIEMLMTNKHITPDALLTATDCFIKQLDKYEKDEMDPIMKALYLLTTQLEHVIKLYKYNKTQFDTVVDDTITTINNDIDSNDLAVILLTSEREMHRILKLSETINSFKCTDVKAESKVKFKEDGKMFFDFLSCFEFGKSGMINIKGDMKLEKKHQISKLIYEGCINSNERIEAWREVAASSKIQPSVLMEFALIYWLNKERNVYLCREMKLFTQLLHAICSIASVEEIYVEYNEISLWWKNVRNILSKSINPFNALTAALACRAVAMTIEKSKEKCSTNSKENSYNESRDVKNENDATDVEQLKESIDNIKIDDETYNLTSEWENVTNDSCQFTLLIGNLEDITILDAIVSQPPPSDETTQFYTLPFKKFDISLESVLSKGKGSVSEIVARWIASSGINPEQLIDKTDIEFANMQSMNNPLGMDNNTDDAWNFLDVSQNPETVYRIHNEEESQRKRDETATTRILEKVTLLKRHFPYSLISSVLLANLCWEFAMLWNQNVSQLKSLEAALDVLRQVPMKQMRRGVCCLLWSIHIKKRMEILAKSINEIGKLPKETLCMQEIALSDAQLVTFLEYCIAFWEIFIDSEEFEARENNIIKSEELWEGCNTYPQSFATLAMSQAPASHDLLILHFQVANVLYMIAYFNIKVGKPLNNLFGPGEQQYFFQSITDKVQPISWNTYTECQTLRTKFLCRIITASMDFIHQETTDGETLSSIQAMQWMGKCQTLASMWELDREELRIHQVCQLYLNGFDRLAKDVVATVNNDERLAVELLPIAGKRLATELSKPLLIDAAAYMDPALTQYLKSLDVPEVVCKNNSISETFEFIEDVYSRFPVNHCDFYLAEMMVHIIKGYSWGGETFPAN